MAAARFLAVAAGRARAAALASLPRFAPHGRSVRAPTPHRPAAPAAPTTTPPAATYMSAMLYSSSPPGAQRRPFSGRTLLHPAPAPVGLLAAAHNGGREPGKGAVAEAGEPEEEAAKGAVAEVAKGVADAGEREEEAAKGAVAEAGEPEEEAAKGAVAAHNGGDDAGKGASGEGLLAEAIAEVVERAMRKMRTLILVGVLLELVLVVVVAASIAVSLDIKETAESKELDSLMTGDKGDKGVAGKDPSSE